MDIGKNKKVIMFQSTHISIVFDKWDLYIWVQDIMKDPHVAADGFSYELEAINEWLSTGHDTSPMTNLRLIHTDLTPNRTLRSLIQDWQNKTSGRGSSIQWFVLYLISTKQIELCSFFSTSNLVYDLWLFKRKSTRV